jgi:hypothetical protein
MTIEVICAWCGCVLGAKPGIDKSGPGLNKPISHGICEQCLEKELAKIQSATVKKTKRIS